MGAAACWLRCGVHSMGVYAASGAARFGHDAGLDLSSGLVVLPPTFHRPPAAEEMATPSTLDGKRPLSGMPHVQPVAGLLHDDARGSGEGPAGGPVAAEMRRAPPAPAGRALRAARRRSREGLYLCSGQRERPRSRSTPRPRGPGVSREDGAGRAVPVRAGAWLGRFGHRFCCVRGENGQIT
ncbi:unnamed protein product [Prorocentrum cordatum]|uniref:Uncharacterized protein n=1 Tax=Prorocentrum cordatum TaxID=2364126 RepID=A0ABN9VFU5_9DINO|nr:unnamed protein product [Polarella glacialis]